MIHISHEKKTDLQKWDTKKILKVDDNRYSPTKKQTILGLTASQRTA